MAVQIKYNYFKDKDKKDMCEVIDEVVNRINKIKNVRFSPTQSKTSMINEVKRILMEVI